MFTKQKACELNHLRHRPPSSAGHSLNTSAESSFSWHSRSIGASLPEHESAPNDDAAFGYSRQPLRQKTQTYISRCCCPHLPNSQLSLQQRGGWVSFTERLEWRECPPQTVGNVSKSMVDASCRGRSQVRMRCVVLWQGGKQVEKRWHHVTPNEQFETLCETGSFLYPFQTGGLRWKQRELTNNRWTKQTLSLTA